MAGCIDRYGDVTGCFELVFERLQQAGPAGADRAAVDRVAHCHLVFGAVEGDAVFGGQGRGTATTRHHHGGHLGGAGAGAGGCGHSSDRGGRGVDHTKHTHTREGEGLVVLHCSQGKRAAGWVGHHGDHTVGLQRRLQTIQHLSPSRRGVGQYRVGLGIIAIRCEGKGEALARGQSDIAKLQSADLLGHTGRAGGHLAVVADGARGGAHQAGHVEGGARHIGAQHHDQAVGINRGQYTVACVGVDHSGQFGQRLGGGAHLVLVDRQTGELEAAVLGDRQRAGSGVDGDGFACQVAVLLDGGF